jgi:predicted ATPase
MLVTMRQPETSNLDQFNSVLPPVAVINTRWVVLSGGPCTGKTSIARCFAKEGVKVLVESADALLQAALSAGEDIESVKTRDDFSWRIAMQERSRLHELNPNQLHIFDTSFIDHFAYNTFYSRKPALDMRPYAEKVRFAAVFSLDPLPAHELTGIRTESASESAQITELMRQEYDRYGYSIVCVPFIENPDERAKWIRDHSLFRAVSSVSP